MKTHTARPLVTAYFAMTADGRASGRDCEAPPLTSHAGKRRLRKSAAGRDAIVVAHGTDTADSAIPEGPSLPLRVLVSNSGELNPGGKVFQRPAFPLVVFSTQRMPARIRPLIARHAELFLYPGRSVDLRKSLEILWDEFGVRRLLCHGGGTLLRALAALDLVDTICLTVTPTISGGKQAPTLTGLPGDFFSPLREFKIVRQSVVSGECFLELRRKAG